MASWIDELFNQIMKSLEPYAFIPNSTLLILTVATILALVTNLSNRFLVDIKRMKAIMKEVNA
ncbi:MAG: hypothetical protein QW476_00910, partial [Candidatus Bathyarchaeia archaeon]